MTTDKKLSAERSARVAAILYIQSHEGLAGVQLGDKIRYAAHVPVNGWSPDTFTVSAADLAMVAEVHAGHMQIANDVAANRRVAFKVDA